MLLTGFGAFSNIDPNPSSILVNYFPEHEVIPVSMSAVDLFLKKKVFAKQIHFGVNDTSDKITIETCAYNEKNFRISDIDGITANGEIIEGGFKILETKFNLSSIIESDLIQFSNDPGRFVCNYLYYKSLMNSRGNSLFIHIPPFEKIPLNIQINVIREILASIE